MLCCGPWGPSPCVGNWGPPGGPRACGWGPPPWPIILAPPGSMEYIVWRRREKRETNKHHVFVLNVEAINLCWIISSQNQMVPSPVMCVAMLLQSFCEALKIWITKGDRGEDVLPVQGKASWPGWPAAGCTAVGCIEGRTEDRGMLPAGPPLLTLQLAT